MYFGPEGTPPPNEKNSMCSGNICICHPVKLVFVCTLGNIEHLFRLKERPMFLCRIILLLTHISLIHHGHFIGGREVLEGIFRVMIQVVVVV